MFEYGERDIQLLYVTSGLQSIVLQWNTILKAYVLIIEY